MTRFLRPVGSTMLIAGLTTAMLAQGTAPVVPVMNLKLGLWEMTSTVKMAGAPAIDTSAMTEQQKAAIQAAMQASMDKPIVTKTCITKDQFSKTLFPDQAGETCTMTATTNTATKFVFQRQCTGAKTTTYTVSIETSAPDSFRETGHIANTTGTLTSTTDVTVAAKWIAADCGTVK